MTTYAGKNVDDATSATIQVTEISGTEDIIIHDEVFHEAEDIIEDIIERAYRFQKEDSSRKVHVTFFGDEDEEGHHSIIAQGFLSDEPVKRYMIDERGNVRPIRG